MVQRDDVVAERLAELEGALEVGLGGLWSPGDVEIVEHCGGAMEVVASSKQSCQPN